MSSTNRNSRTRARQSHAAAAKEPEVAPTHETDDEAEQTKNAGQVEQAEDVDMDADEAEPSMQLLAEAAQNSARAPEISGDRPEDEDDRSSSLSEIDERGATEGSEQGENDSGPLSEEDGENEEDEEEEEEEEDEEDEEEEDDEEDGDDDVELEEDNDTEAETERLEPSPDKTRKRRKVLLNAVLEDNASSVVAQEDEEDDDADTLREKKTEDRELAHGTEPLDSGVSSPANSDIIDVELPKGFGNKKRKRANNDEAGPSRKRPSMDLTPRTGERPHKADDNEASDPAEPLNDEGLAEADEGSGDESQAEEQRDTNANGETEDAMEAETSNVEDAEMEEAAQEGATSSAHSEEELKNKKAALEKLSDIEKDFALFRDKLFADRNMQLSSELSSIQSDPPTHPEYLAMVAAIDKLRSDRIDHAKNVYRYKFQALQRKAVVTRAILQSQYMQRVRQERDKALELASGEWYQIQRERRNFDTEKEVPLNHFAGERSQWVAAQTAYNSEVSILSGVAKYVGFPAAPELEGASSSEMEEDLRKMGITRQTAGPAAPAAVSQANKAKTGAEEQFIAETAWANPQHQQSQYLTSVHRQMSNSLRPASPVSTPAAQKRADQVANGSASTVPVHPSSSLAPTPMSTEPHGPSHANPIIYPKSADLTPSKPSERLVPDPDTPANLRLQEVPPVPKPSTSNARTTDSTSTDTKAPASPSTRPEKRLENVTAAPMAPGVQVGTG